jgi:hypothetical protein
MTWAASVWNALSAASFYPALVPIAFGTLNYFRVWLPNEDDVRRRCNAHRELLNEKINKGLFRIIDKYQRSLRASELRGAPPNDPDLIADHTTEVFRVFRIHSALDSTEVTLRRTHTLLLVTAVIGVFCLIGAFVLADLRPHFTITALLIFMLQACSVLRVRSALKRIRGYESET